MTGDWFTLRDGIELAVLIFAAITWRRDRRKDLEAAEETSEQGIIKHEQNCLKLQNLEDFNRRQSTINEKRDQQLIELIAQTARLTEIAVSTNRRLIMLEDGKH